MAAKWTKAEIDELVATKPIHEVLETVIKSASTYPILESALTVSHTPDAAGGADSEMSRTSESAYRLVEAELVGARSLIAQSIAEQATVFPAGVTDHEGVSFAVPVSADSIAAREAAPTAGSADTSRTKTTTKKAKRAARRR